MESSDAGEYTVRVNSINISSLGYRNDPQCEALALPLLELLAAHAPVTFTVQEDIFPEYSLN